MSSGTSTSTWALQPACGLSTYASFKQRCFCIAERDSLVFEGSRPATSVACEPCPVACRTPLRFRAARRPHYPSEAAARRALHTSNSLGQVNSWVDTDQSMHVQAPCSRSVAQVVGRRAMTYAGWLMFRLVSLWNLGRRDYAPLRRTAIAWTCMLDFCRRM